MSTKKSLLFQLTDQVFSIPLSAVSEVIHKFSVVELPNPPKFFAGTINLRGQIVSIYDLGEALTGATSKIIRLSTCIVVLKYENYQFGIIVDNALGVHTLESDHTEELDSSIAKQFKGLVTCIYKRENDIVLKINENSIGEFLGYRIAA